MRTLIILFFLIAGRLFGQPFQKMVLKIVDGKTSKALGQSTGVHFRNDTIISTVQSNFNGEIGLGFLKSIRVPTYIISELVLMGLNFKTSR